MPPKLLTPNNRISNALSIIMSLFRIYKVQAWVFLTLVFSVGTFFKACFFALKLIVESFLAWQLYPNKIKKKDYNFF